MAAVTNTVSDILDIHNTSVNGNINSNSLTLKGLVRWKLTDTTGTQVRYIPLSELSTTPDSSKSWISAVGDFILKLPFNGDYTFSFSSAPAATLRILQQKDGVNATYIVSGRTATTFTYKKLSENPFLKIRIEGTIIGGITLSVTGALNATNLDNYIYVLCDKSLNKFCNYLDPITPSGNILSSSSCLTINGNTLVSKGTVRWSVYQKATPNLALILANAYETYEKSRTTTDKTKIAANLTALKTAQTNYDDAYLNINNIPADFVSYKKLDEKIPNTLGYNQTIVGECLIKAPTAGTYEFILEAESDCHILINNMTSILSPTSFTQKIYVTNRNSGSLFIKISDPNEVYKMMIIGTGELNAIFYIKKGLGPVSSLNDIVYCLCDSTTLTACTSLLPNNKTIIQGMVQRAWYLDRPKNFTDFSSAPMPDASKGSLFDTIYTSSLKLSETDMTTFGNSYSSRQCTVIYAGYITFPKTQKYFWNAGANDSVMILFGNENMFVDMNAKPLDSQIYYSRACCGTSATPAVNKQMDVIANTTYKFMIIYHNSAVGGSLAVQLRESTNTATPFSVPLSWLSSDFTIDYTNTYQASFNAKCGKNDTDWNKDNCPELLNQNIGNVLISRNNNNTRYSELIINQCSDRNTGTKPTNCGKVYNFDSIEPSIINSYCNDSNRFILDAKCREYANKNPTINDWNTRQTNYCTTDYDKLTSPECLDYYKAKNNKSEVYGKFCTDDDGSKMIASKQIAEDCLTTDTINFTKNVDKIKTTCDSDNLTLFGGFCNDMASNTNINDTVTLSRLDHCNDKRIDADLTTKTGCVPYLSDVSRLDKIDTRIITYCENGTNRFNNALCSKYYGTDGIPIVTSTNNVIQKSIDYKIYRQCIENNKFATDTTCQNVITNNLNKYVSPVLNYCDNVDNIGNAFCTTSYKKLISDTNQMCNSSEPIKKDTFINPDSLINTLNSMSDYRCPTQYEDIDEKPFDIGFIFMLIFLMVIITLLISFLIVRYKKNKDLANNNLNKTV